MIPGVQFIIKKVFDLVLTSLLKKYNLDKFKSYVEEENELDKKVKEIETQAATDRANIAALIEGYKKLEKTAHKPIPDISKRLADISKRLAAYENKKE